MIIYKYELKDWRNFRIEKSELGCAEKPKTYTVLIRNRFRDRIPKEEIGIVSDWMGKCVLLLEDDFEKATAIFLEYYLREIESENRRHKSQIEDYQKLIENIKGCTKERLEDI